MKRFFISMITMVFCLLLMSSFAQKKFTSSQQKLIEAKTDSILDLYRNYAMFTKDVDEDQLSEEYIEGFQDLFTSGDAVVINDLDHTNATPPRITVDQYIEYVRDWYPGGLSVGIKVLKKDAPSFSDYKYHVVVRLAKELKGLFQNQTLHIYNQELVFVVDFTENLNYFKISQIDDNKGGDSCNINKSTANDLLASHDYKKAKNYFIKALHWCPGDPESQAGIKMADSGLSSIIKPIYLDIHFSPGYSLSTVTPDKSLGVNYTSSSGLNYSGGLGLEVGVLKSKKGLLSVGLRVEYALYTSTLKADKIEDQVLMTDIDNESFTSVYAVTSLVEKDQLSYLQIPLYIKYDLSVSKAIAIYFKLGAKIDLAVSKTYTSTGFGEYKGTYSQYNGVTLYGNELEEYGYGNYNLAASANNENINSIFFSANAGIGLTADLSNTIGLFFGVDYTQGLSYIANYGGEDFTISRGKDKIYSLYGYSKAILSNISCEIGVRFRIMQYY